MRHLLAPLVDRNGHVLDDLTETFRVPRGVADEITGCALIKRGVSRASLRNERRSQLQLGRVVLASELRSALVAGALLLASLPASGQEFRRYTTEIPTAVLIVGLTAFDDDAYIGRISVSIQDACGEATGTISGIPNPVLAVDAITFEVPDGSSVSGMLVNSIGTPMIPVQISIDPGTRFEYRELTPGLFDTVDPRFVLSFRSRELSLYSLSGVVTLLGESVPFAFSIDDVEPVESLGHELLTEFMGSPASTSPSASLDQFSLLPRQRIPRNDLRVFKTLRVPGFAKVSGLDLTIEASMRFRTQEILYVPSPAPHHLAASALATLGALACRRRTVRRSSNSSQTPIGQPARMWTTTRTTEERLHRLIDDWPRAAESGGSVVEL